MNKKIKMSLAIVMAGILTYGNVYLAAAERNDIRGTVSSEADFRSDTYSGTMQ